MRMSRILTQGLVLMLVLCASVNASAVTLADLNAYIQRAILTAQSQGEDTRQAVSQAMATAMEQGTEAGMDPVVLKQSLTETALNTATNAGLDMDRVASGIQVAQNSGQGNGPGGPGNQNQGGQDDDFQVITFMPFSFSTPPTGAGLGLGAYIPYLPPGTVFTFVTVSQDSSGSVVFEILSPPEIQNAFQSGETVALALIVFNTGSNSQ